jgi:hypothetical protein
MNPLAQKGAEMRDRPPFGPVCLLAVGLLALVQAIADAEIHAGVEAAIAKNLIPAATEQAYPGYFNITSDGGAYGGEATWPGLDSWQMAGAWEQIL